MTKPTDQAVIIDAVQAARRVLGEYIDPGGSHDAGATVDQLLELLDNRELEAALQRVDRRNSFEQVAIEKTPE
jgi:hypothetical protein